MKIQFIGATRTVTGSMHYIQVNGKKILLDCGLIQGKRKEAFEENRAFNFFNPKEIDYVILSHAHIDHAGNIPNLVKNGFEGTILCTFATRDLSYLMLTDSAHIQKKDVEFINKKRLKQGKNLFEPLYTKENVDETNNLFVSINYKKEFFIDDKIKLSFFDAGHILGSAITLLKIKENGKEISLAFSGDLGRPNLPILKDPDKIPDVDYFICESTYGGRFHDKIETTEVKLASVINKAVKQKGKIIVPSFSVGRTQEMIYFLHKIFDNNLAPKIPIYIDSPLSVNATDIFRLHKECFDDETKEFIMNNEDPFGFKQLKYIKDVDDSKKLNDEAGPLMIISSSGMAEAGRIVHHIANNIENKNNIILMVGYCAENTLGRKLVEEQNPINVLGEELNLNAEVVVLNSLSAHADSNELINYCNNFDKQKLKKMFLVHGDFDQQEKLKSRLSSIDINNVFIPGKGDIEEL